MGEGETNEKQEKKKKAYSKLVVNENSKKQKQVATKESQQN